MKSYYVRHRPGNKGGFILAVIMLLSLGAAVYAGLSNGITNDNVAGPGLFSDMELGDLPPEEPVKYDLSLCYFYSQMDEFEKCIYETFYDMIMHKDIEDYSRSLSIPAMQYSSRGDDLYLIYHAMVEDNPELFYLDVSEEPRVAISGYNSGDYTVLIFTLNPGIENENYMIGAFEYATRRFMEDINLHTSDAEIELQIHDKLIDLVSYDYQAAEEPDKGGLAYTAYGALVDNGEGINNCAVCDGYAKAFLYLLKRAGIMSVKVSGTGGSAVGGIPFEGSHAWNAVLLDGDWYETDCTWDDPNLEKQDLDEDTISILQSEEAYFASTHHWYNRTTEEMTSLPEDPDCVLEYPVENGTAVLHMCRDSYHLRELDSDEYGVEFFNYLNDMLPEAVGTAYRLET